MRHRDSGRKLNRTDAHRRAMFRNMTASLVAHELIRTTLSKAKALRSFAEPLITMARQDTVANRRLVFSRLRSQEAVGKLFTDLGPRYQERPGGYLRILRDAFRPGDKAPMAWVELVDRPDYEPLLDEDKRQERQARAAQRRLHAAQAEAEKAAAEKAAAEKAAAEKTEETAPAAAASDAAAASQAPAAADDAAAHGADAPLPEEPQESAKSGGRVTRLFRGLARLLRRD